MNSSAMSLEERKKASEEELLNSLALYLETRGLVHSQGHFLKLVEKELERIEKTFSTP